MHHNDLARTIQEQGGSDLTSVRELDADTLGPSFFKYLFQTMQKKKGGMFKTRLKSLKSFQNNEKPRKVFKNAVKLLGQL